MSKPSNLTSKPFLKEPATGFLLTRPSSRSRLPDGGGRETKCLNSRY
jgi:hypothetical protein